MPTPQAIAIAEWFYEIRRRPTQFPSHVAENAKAEGEYLRNMWAEEIDRHFVPLRTTLENCFRHLGKEIERKTLNESASDGTQALSREVARVLDLPH